MTTIPEGAVIITPNEMYREMQNIGKSVERLANMIDPALAELRADVVEARAQSAALDTRVRVLENWRWFVLGVAGVFAPAGGFLLSYLFGGGS